MVGPGKQRHPAIVILLCIVTLGVYWFVWQWRAFGEVERFRAAYLKKPVFLVPLIVLHVVGMVLGVMLAADVFSEFLEQVRTASEGGSPASEPAPLIPEFTPVMLAKIGVSVVFYSLQLVFLRAATTLVLSCLPPGSPGPSVMMVVLFNVAFVLGNVPIIGGLFTLAAIVLAIIWIVQIQQAMNRLWMGVAPPFMPPPMQFAPMQAPPR